MYSNFEFYAPTKIVFGKGAEENAGKVVLETEIGAQTLLAQPSGELLPRIC